MIKRHRPRWIMLLALASAGPLTGCYSPYGYYPWGYPYPTPYNWGYAYSPGYSYPPPPPPPETQSSAPNPAIGAPQPLTPPVEQAPLPPAY
jgi:hypothetical protein